MVKSSTYFILTGLLFCLFINVKFINAQQLPNSSFETFENGYNGVGKQPTGWKGSNVKTTYSGTTVTGDMVAQAAGRSGNGVYCHNEFVGALGIGTAAPAYISLGQPWNEVYGMSTSSAGGGNEGGINWTYRPDSVQVWVKRTYTSQEDMVVSFYLWSGTFKSTSYRNRGNSECHSRNQTDEETDIHGTNRCGTTQQGTLIANAEWRSGQQYNDWYLVKFPVNYYSNSIPEKVNMAISAANVPASDGIGSAKEGSKLWIDDLSLIYASTIGEVYLTTNGFTQKFNGFNAGTHEYTKSLGQGATQIPTIECYRNGRKLSGSEINIQLGQVDGAATVITVTAGDASSTSTYTINFVSQQSNNANLAGILINEQAIAAFNGFVTSYNVSLPYGTTTCPAIEAIPGDDGQNIVINNCNSLPGTATIVSTAADGVTSKTYTLNFTIAQLNDNTLANILLNGTGISGFIPTQNNYQVELPLGTTVAPTITPVSAYPEGAQTILLTDNGLSGTSTIVVYSPASSQRSYRINYQITASSYSYLADIKVGGVTLTNYQPNVLNYNVSLPRGTMQLPEITYTKGENNQTVAVQQGGVNGETKITVTAQNGAVSIYRINFSVEVSNYSQLANIAVGGTNIENFDSETLSYDIELPSGTTVLPAITYELGDYAQAVQVTYGGVNGTTTLKVKAENVAYTTSYLLNFTVLQSANAQLDSIFINDIPLDGFSPDVLSYTYILPDEETRAASPKITVKKGSEGQTVSIIAPQYTGTAAIEAVSETGDGSNIYEIKFTHSQSNNNFLTEVSLFGTIFVGFESDSSNYTVEVPAGAITPAIEYVKADSTATVVAIDNGFNGIRLVVYAENGDVRTYTFSFMLPLSDDVQLANIQLWNASNLAFENLDNFQSSTFNYDKQLAWRTSKIPVVNPIAHHPKQKMEVIYGTLNDTTEIRVTAEDGVTQASYYIYFPVTKSGVNTLSSITIDGVEVSGWHPQIANFPILLPYGTTATPKIGFEKAKAPDNSVIFEQNVEVITGNLREPSFVKVTAENGTVRSYKLTFTVDMSALIGENYLDNIFVGGQPIAGFAAGNFSYNLTLPYGTTTMPEITVTKNYPEQSIVITDGGLNGTSVVRAYSNVQGIMPLDYTINIKVSDIPTTTLTSISFDDIVFSGFDPKVHSYIVPVTSQPSVAYVYDDVNLVAQVDINNHKKFQVTVANPNTSESNVYSFWYYYTNDVIPNGMFENVSNQANGGNKPTSWTCQGDVRDRVGLFNLDDQVQSSTDHSEGARSAFMQIQYNGSTTGDEAGILTLGSISSSGSTLNGHSTSCNGGINFRNTPDAIMFDYKYTSPKNMYFAFRLWNTGTDYSAEQSVSVVTNTDGAERSSFYTKTLGINYSGDNRYPQRMNIVLSPSGNENSYIYPTGSRSKLWVDNMRLGYNSTSTNLFVSGVEVPSFVGTTNNLTCYADVPAESMTAPAITFSNAVPDQEVRISITDENSSRQRTVSILSKAEDNITATQYWLILTRPASTNTSLANIAVNGMPVAGFNASTLTYNVPVPNGSTKDMPNLNVVKGEGHQSIAYAFANAVVTITVTADNGSTSVYTLNLVETQSNNALLANLEVEGYDINFSPVIFNYDVVLPNSVLDIPNVIFTKNSDGQTVIFNANHIGENTTVKVFAEDSINFNVYELNFQKIPVETSHLLTNIAVNDLTIAGFDSEIFDYSISINKNTHPLYFEKEFEQDLLVAEYQEDFAKFILNNSEEAFTYTVSYQYLASNNALLADILLDGISLDGFAANTFSYSDTINTAQIPDIAVLIGEAHQNIAISFNNNVVTITVTAEDGITENTYTITFEDNIPDSDYAYLGDLLLDGIQIDNFAPETLNYDVLLPEGTSVLPVITAVKGEDHQQITIVTGGVNGTTIITVTAENGDVVRYEINFTVQLSENALLADILVGGISIEGFEPETFEYSYLLPYHTEVLPLVEYEKGHLKQTVVSEENGIHGDYILTVYAEDANFQNTYTLHFDVALSPYATLDMIFTDSTEIMGFDPEIFDYHVVLPYGTTETEVTWILTDTLAAVEFIPAATLNDTAYIIVSSQDGENQNTYSISFETMLSNNAYLSDILINGEGIRIEASGFISEYDFAPDEFDYTVILPYGTTEMPDIQWITPIPEPDYISIFFENNGLNDISTIEVTSQDGMAVNTYNLNIRVALSDNSTLDDILLFGVSLENYHRDTFEYEVIYPIFSTTDDFAALGDVVYVLGEAHQMVDIQITEEQVILITVTAQNGVNISTYVIVQTIKLSDNALLADILIDGKHLDDFEPERFNYVYLLPFGATAVPEVDYVAQEDVQDVSVIPGHVNEDTKINVVAEDQVSYASYKITFATSTDDPSLLPTAKDVCFSFVASGNWKASSTRNNVSVVIFDELGRLISRAEVPVCDPNDDLCSNPLGVTFRIPQKGGLYFYNFIYNNKKRIIGGKFVW
ncbi:hypothetical protein FACS1894178_6120 [Bacteroidia bacterium]|nr:hypothetical protein FACS1894178_6120 [Bacteroidia bacterium]